MIKSRSLKLRPFVGLLSFLRDHPDVQNIDLMNLAGFCRNCLSNWYKDAAEERGVELSKMDAREIIYGMPYDDWKAANHSETSPEQAAKFAAQQAKLDH